MTDLDHETVPCPTPETIIEAGRVVRYLCVCPLPNNHHEPPTPEEES